MATASSYQDNSSQEYLMPGPMGELIVRKRGLEMISAIAFSLFIFLTILIYWVFTNTLWDNGQSR